MITDIDKTQQAISRAARASALLNDDLVSGSIDQLEKDYIAAWRATGPRDTDARERLWQAVQIVGKFRDHLSMMVSDGKLAQAEINAMAAREHKAT